MNISFYLLSSFLAMVISSAFLVITDHVVFFKDYIDILHIILFFLSGTIPLILYYFKLSRIQKKGRFSDGIGFYLSDIEIDSIYYLGFLITLATLFFSAFTVFVFRQNLDIQIIFAQFSLGLIITGFALWGRLDLQQRNENFSDPDTVVDNYSNKLQKAVNDLDVAYENLQIIINRVSGKFEEASSQFDQSTKSFLNVNLEMSKVSMSLNSGTMVIVEKSKSISDTMVSLESLANNLKILDNNINSFNLSINKVDSSKLTNAIDDIQNSTRLITESANNFQNGLSKSSSSISTTVDIFTKNFENTSNQLSKSLENLSSAFVSIANKVVDTLRR